VYGKEIPPPPKYVVGEAKFGSARLKTLNSGVKQMSDEWIEQRLDSACGRQKAHEIRLAGYSKMMLRYNPNIDKVFAHEMK
jgi:hypothetical protein